MSKRLIAGVVAIAAATLAPSIMLGDRIIAGDYVFTNFDGPSS